MGTDLTKIAILGGTGALGAALAGRLAKAGHAICIGSRDPAKADAVARRMSEDAPGHRVAGASLAGAASQAGIIFVTRRDTEVDRILGLEVAGDHYVTKPINLRDLLARARSVLRRRSLDRKAARNHNSIAFGDWIIDLTRRELLGSDGKPVSLTRAEFDLLAALVGADGRPLSRDYLIEVVSNRQAEVDIRTVDALVARLRRKLVGSGTPVIATVTGVGYKLALSERL
jgi:two-component system torCAD operon response regulator TorR